MTDIVERLRGSPHTRCCDPMCFEGYQVCPHDEEEILEAEERLMEEAAKEIERLRSDNERLRAALREIADGMVDIGGNRRVRFDSCDIARRALEDGKDD